MLNTHKKHKSILNMAINNTTAVYAWCDATWRHEEEYSDFGDAWKGDDYVVLYVPEEYDDEEIEQYVLDYFEGKK